MSMFDDHLELESGLDCTTATCQIKGTSGEKERAAHISVLIIGIFVDRAFELCSPIRNLLFYFWAEHFFSSLRHGQDFNIVPQRFGF